MAKSLSFFVWPGKKPSKMLAKGGANLLYHPFSWQPFWISSYVSIVASRLLMYEVEAIPLQTSANLFDREAEQV